MNFSGYYEFDTVNGPGIRCTLFVSGCSHKCPGCHNRETINPRFGELFTEETVQRILKDLKDTKINRRGLSISGGDPLFFKNTKEVIALAKRVKEECPDKDIWLWTGYKISELNSEQREILEYVDFIVDGRFVKELKDPSLKFRGSSNQNIIDVKEYKKCRII